MTLIGQIKQVTVKPTKDSAVVSVTVEAPITGNLVGQVARLVMEKVKVEISREQLELTGVEAEE